MKNIEVVIDIAGGIATVAHVGAPPGTTVTVTFRDYDTEGATEALESDERGVPCFLYVEEFAGHQIGGTS
jgi:hypothetical protein